MGVSVRKSDFVSVKEVERERVFCRFVCEHRECVCGGGVSICVCTCLKMCVYVCVHASVERYCVLHMTKRETD